MLPEVARFNKFLRRKKPLTSTHIHYTNDLELFFAWAAKSPQAITLRDVDAYIEHCQGLGHAIATVNRRLCAIRCFYRFLALESAGAPPNPVIPERHFVGQGRRLPRDVEDTDVERLFAVITDLRDRAIFLLMLRCGLRVQEVHNLSLDDLYLQPSPGNLPRLWIRGKNGSQRVIYLSPQTLHGLNAWLAIRPNVKDPALFLNYKGRRLGIRGIQKRLQRYCRQADVSITCHQFRHTMGRHMVEARMPVTSIQQLMGHRWLRTTQLYLHISDQQVQADYDAAIAQVARRLSLEGDER